MICRLSGKLESISGTMAVVEPPGTGVAYQVLLPAYLARRLLDRIGETVVLITLQYLESQNQGASFTPRLIGFTTAQERDFFELFTTVKGIGNRKALRAMAEEPAVIARAIASRNTSALQKLPEIGKRMAETVIAELNGKVEGYLSGAELASLDESAQVKPGRATPAGEEAVEALVALGQTRPEAERRVAQAQARAAARRQALESADDIVSAVFAGG
ncbi:MAG: hypothetical protein IT436_16365 [Phycisphaerales bacterium]|nr:hypothetical protein [Phycisphaerales bacterium]